MGLWWFLVTLRFFPLLISTVRDIIDQAAEPGEPFQVVCYSRLQPVEAIYTGATSLFSRLLH